MSDESRFSLGTSIACFTGSTIAGWGIGFQIAGLATVFNQKALSAVASATGTTLVATGAAIAGAACYRALRSHNRAPSQG